MRPARAIIDRRAEPRAPARLGRLWRIASCARKRRAGARPPASAARRSRCETR